MSLFARQLRASVDIAFRGLWRDLGIIVAFFFLFPIGFLFFLTAIVPASDPSARAQILVGSMMMELALININVLAQSIGGDKQSHLYDLWVSLPISPSVYILGTALPWLPITLLVTFVTLAVGISAFGIAVVVSPLLLLAALILVWGSTTGIGFLVAVYGGNPRMINQLAQVLGIIMTFFAPIFYPISALPGPLQDLAYVWPLTWGSILLKALFTGSTGSILVPSLVLAAYTVGGFALIALGLRWRES